MLYIYISTIIRHVNIIFQCYFYRRQGGKPCKATFLRTHGMSSIVTDLLWWIVLPCQQGFAHLDAGCEAVVAGVNLSFDALVVVHQELHRRHIPENVNIHMRLRWGYITSCSAQVTCCIGDKLVSSQRTGSMSPLIKHIWDPRPGSS